MALYRITNEHEGDDCPELVDELGSYYEANEPSGKVNVYCNCGTGEHQMLFLVEAEDAAAALRSIPAGFSRTATTVAQVEEAYAFATGTG